MFENCSTIKRFFLEIIRFLLYVTFIQTQSFSLSKKKKILLCLQLCITKSFKLNCRRIEKIGPLKYLSYLLKLSKEEKRLFQLPPTFYPPLSPQLSSSVCLSHFDRGNSFGG